MKAKSWTFVLDYKESQNTSLYCKLRERELEAYNRGCVKNSFKRIYLDWPKSTVSLHFEVLHDIRQA